MKIPSPLAVVVWGLIWLLVSPSDPAAPAANPSCTYWVAPAPLGDNDNPGTLEAPWATLDYAAEHVPDNSCTVWFSDGEYVGTPRLNRRFTTPTLFKAIHPYQAIFHDLGLVLSISGGRNITLEGFVFRHSGPGTEALVVQIDRNDKGWAELITLRNNIFHDSYGNDLLKIHNGARFITVVGNVFYNQGVAEQQIDVNSVTDVTIQDNIFFNDFPNGGRENPNDTKHFIVIKDSNEGADGLEGSERITVRRNIFLNWQGQGGDTFVQVGNDGKPYHEAEMVRVENNLMIGNALNEMSAAFGVSGAKDVFFVNNTVVGDLPAGAYAFRLNIKDANPVNENIAFYNNIWSDPTGTMGADLVGNPNEFSDGHPAQTKNLILDNNLYWNGGEIIPPGELISPFMGDVHRYIGDPLLNEDHKAIILPRWNGTSFLSGRESIRLEFLRLVTLYGRVPPESPSTGRANPQWAPPDDIFGLPRSTTPNLGAYENQWWILHLPFVLNVSFCHLNW